MQDRPVLCVVLDVAGLGPDPERQARRIFAAGADWIQLRDRLVDDRSLLRTALALVRAREAIRTAAVLPASRTDGPLESPPRPAQPQSPRVIVNRRADVALAVGADGIHAGFDALDAHPLRALLRRASPGERPTSPQPWLGRSLHSVDEVAAAAADRAFDYAHLAPIWDPISKPASRPALGLEVLRRACCKGLPVLAQGGIDAVRAGDVVRAGAAGVALTGALSRAEGAHEPLMSIRRALDEASAMR